METSRWNSCSVLGLLANLCFVIHFGDCQVLHIHISSISVAHLDRPHDTRRDFDGLFHFGKGACSESNMTRSAKNEDHPRRSTHVSRNWYFSNTAPTLFSRSPSLPTLRKMYRASWSSVLTGDPREISSPCVRICFVMRFPFTCRDRCQRLVCAG
jgi:hypothetical protein